jgi:phosphatidylinositol alpha-1,6-mannosyltransferase
VNSGPPRRTLLVTNDFPPRAGGIQTFLWEIARRLPPDSLVVYASRSEGWEQFDAAAPFPVVRDRARMLLPTPRVAANTASVLREHGCTAVWFGAAAPLGLLAPRLRAAGADRVVATTHGHEVGWALVPGPRQLLRRIGAGADVVTVLGAFTAERLRSAVGDGRPGAPQVARLTPGVDAQRFVPAEEGGRAHDGGAARLRQRYGIAPDAPVLLCVSRLVPRKGQDTLIRALPAVLAESPEARLVLVGKGRDEARLRRLAARHGVEGRVVLAGPAPDDELAGYYAMATAFAMPCRTRRAGMDVEGLGIVFLEASAAGLPVIVGDSGGAPDAVRDGETGVLVDGRDVAAVARAAVDLLADPRRAGELGANGRDWVQREWSWERSAERLQALLQG